MRISEDSDMYVSGAERMVQGEFPQGRDFLYSSYMLILAVVHSLGLKSEFVIYLHFLAAIVAIICIYRLTTRLVDNHLVAMIAPLLYILWFKFQQWNLIVYTDAMFSHMVVISIYALVVSEKIREKALAYLLVLFTSLLRPTGIGLLFAVSCYVFYNVLKSDGIKLHTKIIGVLMLFLTFIFLLNAVLSHFIDSFIESYKIAEIIYPGIPLFVDKPTSLVVPDLANPPLVRLLQFAVENPIFFVRISMIKGLLFLGHVKPYYSTLHNIFIAAFLCPAYFFAIKGYRSMGNGKLRLLISSFFAFQFLTVCFTSENWDGRFLLPVLPLIFVLTSVGISGYINQQPAKTNKLNERV